MQGILPQKIVHICFQWLLKDHENEENIETFCNLYKKIGYKLRTQSNNNKGLEQKMDEYYVQMG